MHDDSNKISSTLIGVAPEGRYQVKPNLKNVVSAALSSVMVSLPQPTIEAVIDLIDVREWSVYNASLMAFKLYRERTGQALSTQQQG